MTPKPYLINIVSSLALLANLAFASSSAHAQSYSVTDLGVLPGKTESVPAAVNNMAQVTGTSRTGTSLQSAFRYNSYSKGALEDIGANPSGSISRGFGINEIGQVVGDSTFGNASSRVPIGHAALFNNGLAQDLGYLKTGGIYSRANDINASAQVVGFSGPSRDSDNSRAFIWTASTGMIDIGTLGGPYAQAYAINDMGFVTGNSATAAGDVKATHAFIYQPISITMRATKQMRDLGTLGGEASYGMSINAANHVVGYSAINNTDHRMHAFIHDGTKMRDLGSLGGKNLESDQSFALSVNVVDQVVGYTYVQAEPVQIDPISAPEQVAFLYDRGQMVNLNELIGPANSKYRVYAATAINDKAQIAAIALDNNTKAFHAVLLTPTGK
jgi:probable HAF family extracellular repeat protein